MIITLIILCMYKLKKNCTHFIMTSVVKLRGGSDLQIKYTSRSNYIGIGGVNNLYERIGAIILLLEKMYMKNNISLNYKVNAYIFSSAQNLKTKQDTIQYSVLYYINIL